MTDVFFKGFGSWFAWGEEGASVIVPSYGANGVFSLNVSDEITYNHTGNLPLNGSTLYPTNHPDSEFSRLENLGKTLKMGGLGDIGKYTANNCFFVMDEEQPKDKILVIASPYQTIPEAEAVGTSFVFKQPPYLKDMVNRGLDKHHTHYEIAELWATPERQQGDVNDYINLISQAVEDGDLLAEVSIKNPKALGGYDVIPYSPTILRQAKDGRLNDGYLQFIIHRDKFRDWLINSNQWPLADDCLLAKWWPQTEPQAEAVGNGGAEITGKGRRNKQINKICKVAGDLGYKDLLKIPEGGKTAIKDECLKDTGLFTNDGFNHAWKEANSRNLISMQDKGKYLSN